MTAFAGYYEWGGGYRVYETHKPPVFMRLLARLWGWKWIDAKGDK